MTSISPVSRRLTAALAVFALVAVPLGAYVAGYFWLGERHDLTHSLENELASIERAYPKQWMVTIYQPAGKAEEACRGVEVDVTWALEAKPQPPPPLITPPTPTPVIHIADYHWVREGEHGDGDYEDFLDRVEVIQQSSRWTRSAS
jgi:hypothetical protein